MSTAQNEVWLEAAKENFEQAVQEGNMGLAIAIAKDIYDAGFPREAAHLTESVNYSNE